MMSSLTRYAVAVTVVLCGMAGSTSAQTPQTSATPKKIIAGAIAGKVTIKGKAAPGIVVGVRMHQPMTVSDSTYKGTTDQDGKYRVVDLPPGSYEVSPVAPVYVNLDTHSSRGQMVALAENETADGIDFALVRGGVITGKVTDADGRPVIEQRISLLPVDQSGGIRQGIVWSSAQTDDRGIYRMFGLQAGRYKVQAGQGDDTFFMTVNGRPSYKQTFHPDVTDINKATVVEVTEGSEASNIDIALGRISQTYAVSGRVVNSENGQPVPRVIFGIQFIMDGNRRMFMGSTTNSNNQGEFKIEGLASGKYAVVMMPQQESNVQADAVSFEILDQDVTDLVIKTKPGITIAGSIVLENTDDKAAFAKLLQLTVQGFVQSDAPTGNLVHSATINADGTFRLQGLEPGMASFSLGAIRDRTLLKGFSITRTERDGVVQGRGVEIKNGDQLTGVRLVVNYGSAIVHGVVQLENGALPAGARLYVLITKPGERLPAVRAPQVDARGHFIVDGMPGGSYEFTVTVIIPGAGPSIMPPRGKQTVNVVDGVVNDVAVTVDLGQKPERPAQ